MNPSTRFQIYGLLITLAVGMALGRIASAQRVYEPAFLEHQWPVGRPKAAPTFGSNDRSRWATVCALVDDGTYVIGTRDHGIRFEDGWQSIDCVLHPDKQEFYSSKPPFLATLMAGLYWMLKWLTGWTLASNYPEVVRTLLLVIHPLPFLLYLLALSRLVERHGRTDWGRLFVLSSGCFATMVTPFLITFNNHTLGAFSVMFALVSVMAIWERRSNQGGSVWHHYLLAGLFAAFAATNELPALAFAGAIGTLLLVWSPRRTLCLFLPAAGVVAAGFFVTNYLALGQWLPAYSEFGTPWYQYEGSYWRIIEGQERHGIDFAWMHESRADYALNLLVGHHGFFSLSPIWLLGLAGMIAGLWRWRAEPHEGPDSTHAPAPHGARLAEPKLPWFLPPLALAVAFVVIGYYLTESRGRNYGGLSNGPRWFMWLTPLFLLGLVPVADWLATRRWGAPWDSSSWRCPHCPRVIRYGIPGGIPGFTTFSSGWGGCRIEGESRGVRSTSPRGLGNLLVLLLFLFLLFVFLLIVGPDVLF